LYAVSLGNQAGTPEPGVGSGSSSQEILADPSKLSVNVMPEGAVGTHLPVIWLDAADQGDKHEVAPPAVIARTRYWYPKLQATLVSVHRGVGVRMGVDPDHKPVARLYLWISYWLAPEMTFQLTVADVTPQAGAAMELMTGVTKDGHATLTVTGRLVGYGVVPM